MYKHICVHTYTDTCLYTCGYAYTYTCTNKYTFICTFIHAYRKTGRHTNLNMQTLTEAVSSCVCLCIYTYIQPLHGCADQLRVVTIAPSASLALFLSLSLFSKPIHISKHTLFKLVSLHSSTVYTVCVYIYIHMYIRM